MIGVRRGLVAIAAGLALADASIVALALPPILTELHTTITGVAAIVGVYALVLAAAIWPAARLRAGPWGFALFAAASLACGVAGSLALLLVLRALQAVGAALALLSAFAALDAGESRAGRRLWLGAALVGTAAGPAIGGVLTELFDWRSIFLVQAPIAAAAALASVPRGERMGGAAEPAGGSRSSGAAAVAAWFGSLALTAAAFTAVLFLLVLELVAGFAISPARAALGVAVLPVAALAAAAIPGERRPRALAGALLVAGGAAALAFLPGAGLAWTIVPQLLAGAGIGLALPAYTDERTVAQAAHHLVARHAGIVVVLAILAPIATRELTESTERAILQGTALVLDARMDPIEKVQLAPRLLAEVDTDRPRAQLTAAIERHRAEFAGPVYDRLATRLDDVIVIAIQDAFRTAYLVAAALALLAAALLVNAARRPAIALAAAAALAAGILYLVEHRTQAPAPVALQDPCRERALPDSGGITGALQDEALRLLDRGACSAGAGREELTLALFDQRRALDFERDHGVDPRSLGGLLSLLTG